MGQRLTFFLLAVALFAGGALLPADDRGHAGSAGPLAAGDGAAYRYHDDNGTWFLEGVWHTDPGRADRWGRAFDAEVLRLVVRNETASHVIEHAFLPGALEPFHTRFLHQGTGPGGLGMSAESPLAMTLGGEEPLQVRGDLALTWEGERYEDGPWRHVICAFRLPPPAPPQAVPVPLSAVCPNQAAALPDAVAVQPQGGAYPDDEALRHEFAAPGGGTVSFLTIPGTPFAAQHEGLGPAGAFVMQLTGVLAGDGGPLSAHEPGVLPVLPAGSDLGALGGRWQHLDKTVLPELAMSPHEVVGFLEGPLGPPDLKLYLMEHPNARLITYAYTDAAERQPNHLVPASWYFELSDKTGEGVSIGVSLGERVDLQEVADGSPAVFKAHVVPLAAPVVPDGFARRATLPLFVAMEEWARIDADLPNVLRATLHEGQDGKPTMVIGHWQSWTRAGDLDEGFIRQQGHDVTLRLDAYDGHRLAVDVVGYDLRGDATPLGAEHAPVPLGHGSGKTGWSIPERAVGAAAGVTLLAALAKFLAGPFGSLRRRMAQDPLRHPSRRAIMALVAEAPGIHLRRIQRVLGFGWGKTEHHVRVLEEAARLTRRGSGKHVLIYPVESAAVPPREASVPAGRTATVFRLFGNGETLTQRDVGRMLGISRQAAGHHLRWLVAHGHLEASGHPKRYAAAKDARSGAGWGEGSVTARA